LALLLQPSLMGLNCRRSSVPSEGHKYQSDFSLRKPGYLYSSSLESPKNYVRSSTYRILRHNA